MEILLYRKEFARRSGISSSGATSEYVTLALDGRSMSAVVGES